MKQKKIISLSKKKLVDQIFFFIMKNMLSKFISGCAVAGIVSLLCPFTSSINGKKGSYKP